MKNDYEIRGDHVAIFLRRRDGQVFETLVDRDDLERVAAMPYWHHLRRAVTDYARTTIGEQTIYLHRFITDAPAGLVVDHINHNGLDNRKSNLRVITQSGNLHNRAHRAQVSRSGVPGITQTESGNWHVRVRANGTRHTLGTFESLNEAIAVHRAFNDAVIAAETERAA